MIKWLLELVYALSLKRIFGVSLRVALHCVRDSYSTKVEIENLKYMIEDHVRKKGVNYDAKSD